MTSGNTARTALLTAVLLATVTGCAGTADDAGAPGSVAGEGPARPAAGGEDLVVEEQPLEAPVVLDPVPDGLLLTDLSYDPPGSYLLYNESSGRYEPSRATLYGDPDLADTLDGPVLLVGTSSGSATIAGPGYDAPGEQVELGGGRTGRVVPDTDRTWVVIEHNDYTEFVVGRGIDEDELVAAARGADFDSATTALAPDVVPDGLEPLVAGSPQDRPGAGSGESMSLRGDGSWVSVHAVRADPRLAALWGFWVEDATGTAVRGHLGSAGDLQGANVGDPDAEGRVWAEDGMVLAVIGTTDAEGERAENRGQLLDRVVEQLRVGTWGEFEALGGEIRTRPPTREESPCPPDGGFVSGVEGTSRWVFQLQPNALSSTGEWSACAFELASGGSGGSVIPPPPGELAGEGAGSGIVGGVAPPGTDRVTVTAADGRVLEAQLSDEGPRPGERVWGTFVLRSPSSTGDSTLTVTAYDAAGAVLDSKAG
jgi:hypothetical protein